MSFILDVIHLINIRKTLSMKLKGKKPLKIFVS